jgi:hypothetical protein
MDILWLSSSAWWGLAGLAIPIAIHLLVRQKTRRVDFPSLRFLRATRLLALRGRVISEWPLLLARLALIALVVAALAGPVFVSPARRAEWNRRVARAIVVVPQQGDAAEVRRLVTEEREASFTSEVFASAERLPDAIADAGAWLERQPPATRELVVIGDLREGSARQVDFDVVPRFIGIRFLPVAVAEAAPDLRLMGVGDAADQPTQPYRLRVSPKDDRTVVTYERVNGSQPWVTVQAPPADQSRASAILQAVLAEGVLIGRHDDRRLVLIFDGVDQAKDSGTRLPSQMWMRRALEHVPGVLGWERDGALNIRLSLRAVDSDAPAIVQRVITAAFDESLVDLEPVRIPAGVLAAWSRPSGDTPADTRPQDEGDRRWFWAGALVLLIVEQVLRRSSTQPSQSTESPVNAEARVA